MKLALWRFRLFPPPYLCPSWTKRTCDCCREWMILWRISTCLHPRFVRLTFLTNLGFFWVITILELLYFLTLIFEHIVSWKCRNARQWKWVLWEKWGPRAQCPVDLFFCVFGKAPWALITCYSLSRMHLSHLWKLFVVSSLKNLRELPTQPNFKQPPCCSVHQAPRSLTRV